MIVGQGRAGKSSLVNLFLGHAFKEESPSTCGVERCDVNVSKGVTQSTERESDSVGCCQWLEYGQEGSHLDNALAILVHTLLSPVKDNNKR